MQRLQNLFKLFDAFGVPLTLKVEPTSNYYKSSIGGVTTIVIYILSILYAGYIFGQWYNNQMSPKITTMLYQSDFGLLDLNYGIFQMFYYPLFPDNIDPFEANILTLVNIGQPSDSGDLTITPILSKPGSISKFNTSLLEFNQGITVYNRNGSTKGGSELAIILCMNALMPNGTQCANEEQVENFFKQQSNVIIFTYKSFVLDMDGTPQANYQTYKMRIEKSLTYLLTVNLLSNYYMIKDNIFTDQSRSVEYLSGAEVYGQTNNVAYSTFGKLICVAGLYIALQPQQTKVIMEFPHIGEILAQIGSIIQVLFLIKYLIALLNYDKLWDELVSQTMNFYYPHLTHISYEYTYFNRVKSVSYKNKKIDKDQFLKFKQELTDKIKMKLTFTNLIYEISRLYFLMRAIANTNLIRSSHNMGIRLEFSNNDLGSISSRSGQLNDDLEMISLIRRQQNMDLINDEIIMQEFTPNATSMIS